MDFFKTAQQITDVYIAGATAGAQVLAKPLDDIREKIISHLFADCRDEYATYTAMQLVEDALRRLDDAIVRADGVYRLREALQSIAGNTCCDKCQEAALVARAALKSANGEVA